MTKDHEIDIDVETGTSVANEDAVGPAQTIQGEGDRASARLYNAHVNDFVSRGQVEPAAHEARRAVDGPEGPSLRAAEEAGRAPANGSVTDVVIALAQRLRRAAMAFVDEMKKDAPRGGDGGGTGRNDAGSRA